MKWFLSVLLFGFSTASFAQSKADYELAMSLYTKYYNSWIPDSLKNMFGEGRYPEEKNEWLRNVENNRKKNGDIKSYKYITVDTNNIHRVALFKVNYLTTSFIQAITFDKDKSTHMLWADSKEPRIDSMLKNY